MISLPQTNGPSASTGEPCEGKYRDSWKVIPSQAAMQSINKIRSVFEDLSIKPNPQKPVISLCAGDPTIFGNLGPNDTMLSAVERKLHANKFHGYNPSSGMDSARAAVAKNFSLPAAPLEMQDIVMASGCSHALDLSIIALADTGDNILSPKPGFPIYQTLASTHRIECRMYNLQPHKQWEIDLNHLESLIDAKTKAIVMCNPSNPCGSVYSRQHLIDLLELAERYKIPIIADEVYGYMVFPGETFYPLASLTTTVPILSCNSLAKRFLAPGWRMGWVQIHDRNNVFGQPVRKALTNLAQRLVGPNSIIQAALPEIFDNAPPAFFNEPIALIQRNAKTCYETLSSCPGLKPLMPQGAMYMMVKIEMDKLGHTFHNDVEFVKKLMTEESVFLLPGTSVYLPNYFRIVISLPEHLLMEACDRIKQFVLRYAD